MRSLDRPARRGSSGSWTQIRDLEKQPPPSRQLRYHVPVSKTVTIDEWHFECQHQRATFFPLGDLEAAIQAGLPDKIKQLHSQWQVSDVTPRDRRLSHALHGRAREAWTRYAS